MKSTDSLTLITLTNKYLTSAAKLVESVFKHEDEVIKSELEASINKKILLIIIITMIVMLKLYNILLL